METPLFSQKFKWGSLTILPCRNPQTCYQYSACQPPALSLAEVMIRGREDIAQIRKLLDAIKVLQTTTIDVSVTGPEDLLRELSTGLDQS